MTESRLYHEGNRELQDRFESRRIADRLEETLCRARFTESDKKFIEGSIYFFLATADAAGRPDCSYKGGMPGFVRVVEPDVLAFPDYDGNGMFKSLGNIRVHAEVGLLFIALHGKPRRLRVNGTASLHFDDPLQADFPDAQLVVRVRVQAIFPNCPRYIPQMELVDHSVYAPRPDYAPPVPEWKTMDLFKDYLPPPR